MMICFQRIAANRAIDGPEPASLNLSEEPTYCPWPAGGWSETTGVRDRGKILEASHNSSFREADQRSSQVTWVGTVGI